MLKKTFITFVVLFFVQFLFSCIGCDCPQQNSFKFDFDFAVFDKKIIKDTESNEIAFSIQLKDSSKTIIANSCKGSFISSAMACSCNFQNYGVIKSPLKSIKIFTINHLNSNYKAGSDVSDFFVGYENNGGYRDPKLYDNLGTMKNKMNNSSYYVSMDYKEKVQTGFSFFMKEKLQVKNSKFKVQFMFENSLLLETITTEFIQK